MAVLLCTLLVSGLLLAELPFSQADESSDLENYQAEEAQDIAFNAEMQKTQSELSAGIGDRESIGSRRLAQFD